MDKKHRFFIYDRKEMLTLFFLAVMIAVFAFTLGVHLGKRIDIGVGGSNELAKEDGFESNDDTAPGNVELLSQSKDVDPIVKDSLNKELQEEVARTGIKLDTPRQVELPEKSKDTTTSQAAKTAKKKDDSKLKIVRNAQGKYTLQVASFQTVDEVKARIKELEKIGVTPFYRQATIAGRGKWYRVFIGGYPTRRDADESGRTYISKKVIQSFVVRKMPE